MSRSFEIYIRNIRKYKNIKVVKLIGELDMTSSVKFNSLIDIIVNNSTLYLLGDLTRLRFIDSIGNLNLISISVKARKQGGGFKIFGVQEQIKNIFEEIGLTKIIPIYNNFKEALSSTLAEIRDHEPECEKD